MAAERKFDALDPIFPAFSGPPARTVLRTPSRQDDPWAEKHAAPVDGNFKRSWVVIRSTENGYTFMLTASIERS